MSDDKSTADALSGLQPLASTLGAHLRLVDPAELAAAEARRAAAEADRAARERAEDRRRRADLAGVPRLAELRDAILVDRPRSTPALVAAHAAWTWRAGRAVGQTNLFGGPPGTGKSCACAYLAVRVRGSLWVAASDLDLTPRSGYSECAEWWRRVESAPLLVLDDLGCERVDADLVSSLLVTRHDRALWTVASTNLDELSVKSRYFAGPSGDRLADRTRGQRERGLRAYAPTGSKSLRGGR